MIDMVRGYVDIAAGLSEAAAVRMMSVARNVAIQGAEMSVKTPGILVGAAVEAAEDIAEASGKSGEVMGEVVRTEVQRVMARLGYVREEELAAVRSHVQRLERTLHLRHDRDAAAAGGQ